MEEGHTAGSNYNKRRRAESGTPVGDRPDKMPKTSSPPRTRRGSTGDPMVTESSLLAMLEGVEARLGARFENMGLEVTRNKNDIKEVRKLIGDTETRLLERMDIQSQQIEDLVKTGGTRTTGMTRLSTKNEETYWHYRKSLSVWPVAGEDASLGLKAFLTHKLKFTEEQFRELGRIQVKRLKEPQARSRKEVFCTFETKETRDLVKAAARHLAGEAGFGLRAPFPGFLIDTFRVLESIGYHLRSGDESIKRAINYDDSAMDLIIDIKVGDEWRRIRPDEARETLEKNPHIKRCPTEINSDGLSQLLARGKNRSPATGANATPRQ